MLRILSVAYPLAPACPDAVGGAEQILSSLDAGLVKRGRQSIVIACEGSTAAGRLIASGRIPDSIDDAARRAAWARHRMLIENTLRTNDVDLVHFHGLDFYEYLPETSTAILATIHLPPAWYPASVFTRSAARPPFFLNFVSAAQKAGCPLAADAPVIENGIEIPDIPAGVTEKRDFVMAVGRICPEKNFHVAIAAARRAGTVLVLAGRVFGYESGHGRRYSSL